VTFLSVYYTDTPGQLDGKQVTVLAKQGLNTMRSQRSGQSNAQTPFLLIQTEQIHAPCNTLTFNASSGWKTVCVADHHLFRVPFTISPISPSITRSLFLSRSEAEPIALVKSSPQKTAAILSTAFTVYWIFQAHRLSFSVLLFVSFLLCSVR